MFNKKTIFDLKNYLLQTFSTKDLIYIFREVEKDFDIDKIKPDRSKFTLSHPQIINLAIPYFFEKKKIDELINEALSIDEISGKTIRHIGTDHLMKSLSEIGIFYNPDNKRLEKINSSGPDFGILFSGKEYYITLVSIDMVNSTKHIKNRDDLTGVKLMNEFKNYITDKINKYDGRIWKWEGDGGIVAFYQKDDSAIICSLELLMHLSLFNSFYNPIDDGVDIRIACDNGQMTFKDKFEEMYSDVIYNVEKIQNKFASPNELLITDNVFMFLNGHIRDIFEIDRTKEIQVYKLNKDKIIKQDN